MTNKRNTSITRRIAAASAVAVLSLGAAACGSDDGTDDPVDGVDNTIDDMMPDTTDDMMPDTTDDMMTDTTDG